VIDPYYGNADDFATAWDDAAEAAKYIVAYLAR
jgi:hypothetical protein